MLPDRQHHGRALPQLQMEERRPAVHFELVGNEPTYLSRPKQP
jgi:hypothetical protein